MRRLILAILRIFPSVFILGSILLPGYVMTLDMVFTPSYSLASLTSNGFNNAFLVKGWVFLLIKFLPGWIVEKIVLIAMVNLVLYTAHRFICYGGKPSNYRISIAMFFFLNPFVYTRFLAGHWTHLFAYALLPLVLHESLLLPARQAGEWKRVIGLGLLLALVFAFSLHLGVMALVILGAGVFAAWPTRTQTMWCSIAIVGLAFMVSTSYWTIPAFLHCDASVLTIFTENHLTAFRPAADPHLGTIGNLLSLYGFWGEREPWAQQFIWVKNWPWVWGISGTILAILIVSGLVFALKNREQRRLALVMLGLGCLAVIFANGMAETLFLPINRWLFTHLGFWRGFRDSQKWIALLVLVYAFFLGVTMQRIEQLSSRVWRWSLSVIALVAILLYTFPMLGGFWGQLKPVWYPASWDQANVILRQDPQCKAIFLPWHQYFTLKFNHNLLTASPARDFFDCEIVQSRQVELEGIENQGQLDPQYDALEGVITGKDGYSAADSIQFLRKQGIHFVIFVTDIQDTDPWNYSFLDASSVDKIEMEGLTLYQLVQ